MTTGAAPGPPDGPAGGAAAGSEAGPAPTRATPAPTRLAPAPAPAAGAPVADETAAGAPVAEETAAGALVADELALVRRGIAAALADAGLDVVAQVASGREAVDLVTVHAPAVVVVGSLRDVPAVEVVRRLRAAPGTPAVVVLLGTARREELAHLLAHEADALLLRSVGPAELAAVVGRVLAGEQVVAPALLSAVIGTGDDAPLQLEGPAALTVGAATDEQVLTPRERQVLALLAEGRANREIAASLFVSLPTVKTHVAHIYAKLGARNRNEALGRAVALGLLT